jgi:uncharacterized protein YbjQ (UPF0145 family)
MSGGPYRDAEPTSPPVVVTTGSDVPGRRVVEILGVVRGIALRRTASENALGASIATREAAEHRLIDEAKALRAEAVICMRYDSNESEVVAYGTAVRLQTT